jgi:hypothetical protein
MQPAQFTSKPESTSPSITLLAPPHLPESTAVFFQSVSAQGYPQPVQKAQPWRGVWIPQPSSTDGKLLVACPRNCDYGMHDLYDSIPGRNFLQS